MVALPRALGGLHVAQQRVHLGQREAAVGLDRGAAGDVAEQGVRRRLEMMPAALLAQVGEHLAHQRPEVRVREQRRHGTHREPPRREHTDVEARSGELLRVVGEGLGVVRGDLDHHRLEQPLHRGPGAELALHALVEHTLMRGVRIDQHQPRLALRQHIHAVQLRDGDAERTRTGAETFRQPVTHPRSPRRSRRCRQRRRVRVSVDGRSRGTRGGPEAFGFGERQHARRGGRADTEAGRADTEAGRRRGGRGDARPHAERIVHGTEHEIVDLPAVAEADLEFLRVRVDIDPFRIDVEVEQIGGLPSVVEHIAIAEPHRTGEQTITDRPTVDERELLVARGACGLRLTEPAGERHAAGATLDGQRAGDEVLAHDRGDARALQ